MIHERFKTRASILFMAEDCSMIKVYRHLTTFIPGRSPLVAVRNNSWSRLGWT